MFVTILNVLLLHVLFDTVHSNACHVSLSFGSNSRCAAQYSCSTPPDCDNPQCIDWSQVCDGKIDCVTGRDELEAICPYTECQENSFRCKYGACVPQESKCNGKIDCADQSDEHPEMCNSVGTTATDEARIPHGCVIPEPPDHGAYKGIPSSINPAAGIVANDSDVLVYTCDKNFGLNSMLKFDHVICFNKEWTKSFPVCLHTCPALPDTIERKCEYGNKEVNCSLPMLQGTRVTCKDNFEPISTTTNESVIVCRNGSGDQEFIKCVPECGKSVAKGAPFLIKGVPAKLGEFPWHVGIYRKESVDASSQYICGGSLLNMNTVLSAAHCFAEGNGEALKNTSLFTIAAGKFYRVLNDTRDSNTTQIRNIKKIKISEHFQCIHTNYRADVAIVVLQKPFEVTIAVQPVCVDWDNQFEEEQLHADSIGDVVGWGLTAEKGSPSEELQRLRMPFIGSKQCFEVEPLAFYPFLTEDKFCAGHANGSSVRFDDSGGGLVFLRKATGRYYIRGIVSSGPKKDDDCDTRKYTLFTTVSHYLATIIKVMSEN